MFYRVIESLRSKDGELNSVTYTNSQAYYLITGEHIDLIYQQPADTLHLCFVQILAFTHVDISISTCMYFNIYIVCGGSSRDGVFNVQRNIAPCCDAQQPIHTNIHPQSMLRGTRDVGSYVDYAKSIWGQIYQAKGGGLQKVVLPARRAKNEVMAIRLRCWCQFREERSSRNVFDDFVRVA